MKPYSKEFRGEVLAACDRGRGTHEVATHFKVSEAGGRRIKQERRELNKVALLLKRRRIPLWAPLAEQMRDLIHHKPHLTLRELKAELQTDLSVQTLCTALQRRRLTIKKVLIASERKRLDVAERREELQREQPNGDIIVTRTDGSTVKADFDGQRLGWMTKSDAGYWWFDFESNVSSTVGPWSAIYAEE